MTNSISSILIILFCLQSCIQNNQGELKVIKLEVDEVIPEMQKALAIADTNLIKSYEVDRVSVLLMSQDLFKEKELLNYHLLRYSYYVQIGDTVNYQIVINDILSSSLVDGNCEEFRGFLLKLAEEFQEDYHKDEDGYRDILNSLIELSVEEDYLDCSYFIEDGSTYNVTIDDSNRINSEANEITLGDGFMLHDSLSRGHNDYYSADSREYCNDWKLEARDLSGILDDLEEVSKDVWYTSCYFYGCWFESNVLKNEQKYNMLISPSSHITISNSDTTIYYISVKKLPLFKNPCNCCEEKGK